MYSSDKEFEEEPRCTSVLCPFHYFCGCEWRGLSESLIEHCTNKHRKFVQKGYKKQYEIERFKSIKVVKDFPHVIEAHGSVFLFWLRKFPSGVITIRIYCMECCVDPIRYKFFITFQDETKIQLDCCPLSHYNYGFNRADEVKFEINSNKILKNTDNFQYNICIKDVSFERFLTQL